MTRYILYREHDGKEQYYHTNDPRWRSIELYNDLMLEDACFGSFHSGCSDSILDTQLFITEEAAITAAEGWTGMCEKFNMPTYRVNHGSKQASFEYFCNGVTTKQGFYMSRSFVAIYRKQLTSKRCVISKQQKIVNLKTR